MTLPDDYAISGVLDPILFSASGIGPRNRICAGLPAVA